MDNKKKTMTSQLYKKRSSFSMIWHQLRKNKGAIILYLEIILGMIVLSVYQ